MTIANCGAGAGNRFSGGSRKGSGRISGGSGRAATGFDMMSPRRRKRNGRAIIFDGIFIPTASEMIDGGSSNGERKDFGGR